MTDLAIPRVDTATRPSAPIPRSDRTEHILYRVASTDGDGEFYVWADSTEAVVSVVFARTESKRLPPMHRGITVLR